MPDSAERDRDVGARFNKIERMLEGSGKADRKAHTPDEEYVRRLAGG